MVEDLVVAVPGLTCTGPKLDEADSALQQTTRDEGLAAKVVFAIGFAHGFGFLADVEGIGSLHLHAVGQLEALDAGIELLVVLALLEVVFVQCVEQIELATLLLEIERAVLDELDELIHLRVFRVDVGALVDAGEEGGLPVLRAPRRHAFRAHGDVAGQVFILGTEPVSDPRTHAGTMQTPVATVHEAERGLMIWHIGIHGADDAEVIGIGGGFGKDVAHLQAALTILLEGKRRLQSCSGRAFGLQHTRQRLAIELRQQRLRVKGIHLRRSTIHEEVDHPLRFRLMMRLTHAERVRAIHTSSLGLIGTHEVAQSISSEPRAQPIEQLAAGEEVVFEIEGMMGHGGVLVAVHAIRGMALVVADNHDENGLCHFIDSIDDTVRKSAKIGTAINAS